LNILASTRDSFRVELFIHLDNLTPTLSLIGRGEKENPLLDKEGI